MQPGLPGGADRPPPSAAPESDFHAAYRRLRELASDYYHISRAWTSAVTIRRVIDRFNNAILRKFTKFGGNTMELGLRPSGITKADQAYDVLHEMASQAERDRDFGRAGVIREALGAFDKRGRRSVAGADHETRHTRIPVQPGGAATAGGSRTDNRQSRPSHCRPTLPVNSTGSPSTRQLRGLARQYSNAGQALAHADACSAAH